MGVQRRSGWVGPALVGVLVVGALWVAAVPAQAAAIPGGSTVIVSAGQGIHAGLYATGSTVTIDGTVDQSTPSRVASALRFAGRAGQPAGGAVRDLSVLAPAAATPGAAASALGTAARRYLILAVLGALLLWLAPRWTRRLADAVQTRPWGSLGWGILAVLLFLGAVIVVLAGTLILALITGLLTLGGLAVVVALAGGLFLAILGSGFWVFITYGAQIVVSYEVGRWILARGRAAGAVNRFAALLLGLVLLVILTGIPVLGGLTTLVVVLLGLGALWYSWTSRGPAVAGPPPGAAPPI